MKTTNLNKKEVIAALAAGHKVTHRFFQEGEYCYQNGSEIVHEDGARMSVKEFWGIREGGLAWDMEWSIFVPSVILQSEEMICETQVYKEDFFFQRMTKDSRWYVTYKNRIIAHGQYQNDLKEWIDVTYPTLSKRKAA